MTRLDLPAEDDSSPLSIIAVMGVTGSGKSNFLKLVTGMDVATSDGLESCQWARSLDAIS